jgi:glycosidase
MEIFVRSYQDSNGDGIGDLPGLIARLPYLHELGIRGLWLLPVHPSEDGDHGYAVSHYREIHPDYGTLADFDRLLAEAHALGIGVILDYVINHCASDHPLFADSASGPRSPRRDWFVWADGAHPQGWRIYDADPWRPHPNGGTYFAAFSKQMPDFNWRSAEVEAWHHANLRFWLDRGVDGFRFDAVGHLVENGPEAWDCQPENVPIMRRIRTLLDGYEGRFMVNEVPGDPATYAREAGSAFGFDIHGHVMAAARGQCDALAKVAHHFETMPPSTSTLLSNHDSFAGARVADQLNGDEARLRLAAALLLLLPGTPFIYYGEEIGLRSSREPLLLDHAMRTPMSWRAGAPAAGFSSARPYRVLAANAQTHNVDLQRADPGSLWQHYRRLIGLRHARPSLARGGYELLGIDGPRLEFRRWFGNESTVVRLRIDEPGLHVADEAGGLPLFTFGSEI